MDIKIIGLIFLFITLVGTGFSGFCGQSNKRNEKTGSNLDTSKADRADKYLQQCTKLRRFFGSVLIAHRGEIIFRKGYGKANIELDVPNTPDKKYRIGSVTKPFTALAILQLKEQGQLELTDPAVKYMSDFSTHEEITIYNLLTHSSGLQDYTSFDNFQRKMKLPTTTDKIVKSIWEKPHKFSPGEQYNYCNSNYIVLGYIIENISGENYEAFLEKNIFDPLGMENSGYDSNKEIIINRAAGYRNVDGTILNAEYIDMRFPDAAGALYSTVEDLHILCQGLINHEIVREETLKNAFTAHKENYGYGWMIESLYGRKRIYHGGTINGFMAMINIFTEDDLAIITLSNLETAKIEQINRDLIAIIFEEEYEPPKEEEYIELKDEVLESLTGKYIAGDKLTIEVTRDGNHLNVKMPGQPEMKVFPKSQSEFSPKGAFFEIAFKKDDQKRVTGLIITQARQTLTAKKHSDN